MGDEKNHNFPFSNAWLRKASGLLNSSLTWKTDNTIPSFQPQDTMTWDTLAFLQYVIRK